MSFKPTHQSCLEPDLTGLDILAHKVSVQLVGSKGISGKHGRKDNWWGLICIYMWPTEGELHLLENGNIWQICFQSEILLFLFFFVTVFFSNKTLLFSIVKCLKFPRNFALNKSQ